MTAEIELKLPPGYMICRKGGRPPKLARDMAVLAASIWLQSKDMSAREADYWIIEEFKFKSDDPSEVRRSLRKAKMALPREWGAFVVGNFVTIVETVGSCISANPDAKGWAWREGMLKAVKIMPSSVKFYPHPDSNHELMEVVHLDMPKGQ